MPADIIGFGYALTVAAGGIIGYLKAGMTVLACCHAFSFAFFCCFVLVQVYGHYPLWVGYTEWSEVMVHVSTPFQLSTRICKYSLEPPCCKNKEIIEENQNFNFYMSKILCIMHGRVFVMHAEKFKPFSHIVFIKHAGVYQE